MGDSLRVTGLGMALLGSQPGSLTLDVVISGPINHPPYSE